MKKLLCLMLAFSFNALATEQSALIKSCADCHGENGISTEADVPTIAGASEFYLNDTLSFYKSGDRIAIESKYRQGDLTRPATDMQKISKALSEEQIAELAAFFSKQKFVPVKQNFDKALADKGQQIHEIHCTKCHEEGGSSADDDSGILAGQHTAYLKEAFTLFRNGKRSMEDKMKVKVDKLSDDDVEALLNYYASQQ